MGRRAATPPIPGLLIGRLRSARDFLGAIDVGSGSLLQVGDCDSGRCGALMIEPLTARNTAEPDRAVAVEARATRECMDLLDGIVGTRPRDALTISLRDVLPQ